MHRPTPNRLARALTRSGWVLLAAATAMPAVAQPPASQAQRPRTGLDEPVFRVSRASEDKAAEHPLAPALRIAEESLASIQRDLIDYKGIMVKQERIDGVLGEQEFLEVKVRNRKVESGRIKTPFAIYVKHLKPAAVAGQEAIFVEGRNNNQIAAHGVGMQRMVGTLNLDPTGWMAMRGQRYPITDAGIENLVNKLIEKGRRDSAHGECEVQFFRGAKINDRPCTMLQVTHPHERPHFDFHIAQIFIDDEWRIPVRYAAYVWPEKPGGKPVLLEAYTYMNLELNCGLTDKDFDPKNAAYNYP